MERLLKQFTRPLDEVTRAEDEDHDPEYNVLADEEIDKGIVKLEVFLKNLLCNLP